MQKSALLAAIQREIQNHDLTHFVDEPPSIAQGGRGVVITGCSRCRKRFGTVSQFLDHLTHDVLPPLIDKLSTDGKRESLTDT
jgi:hypothetical protein